MRARVSLPPSEPLPAFRNHAEWCTWLWTRGCLAVSHRKCRVSDRCVARDHAASGDSWRYEKSDAAP
jgi:hypothetical protein